MYDLTETQTMGLVIFGLAIAAGFTFALIYAFTRPKKRSNRPRPAPLPPQPEPLPPQPEPFVAAAPAEPTSAMLAAFEERSEISSGGGFALVAMVLINVVGFFVIFASRTYVEATVFGQLANILDRTNGLLILVLINQALMCGVLLGRSRTFIMKKVPG